MQFIEVLRTRNIILVISTYLFMSDVKFFVDFKVQGYI